MQDENYRETIARMQEEHMGQKDAAPLEHYAQEFAAADPAVLSARSGVTYDEDAQAFRLQLLGRPLMVSWPGLECVLVDTGEEQRTNVRILMACLLLRGKIVESQGGFLSYPEIPWGDHYFKAFQGRCIYRFAGMYRGEDGIERFKRAAEALGGTPAQAGDAAYDFEFVDGVAVRLILWEGDDEYPTTSQILFSDNTPLAFAAEELAVVGDVLLGNLKRAL